MLEPASCRAAAEAGPGKQPLSRVVPPGALDACLWRASQHGLREILSRREARRLWAALGGAATAAGGSPGLPEPAARATIRRVGERLARAASGLTLAVAGVDVVRLAAGGHGGRGERRCLWRSPAQARLYPALWAAVGLGAPAVVRLAAPPARRRGESLPRKFLAAGFPRGGRAEGLPVQAYAVQGAHSLPWVSPSWHPCAQLRRQPLCRLERGLQPAARDSCRHWRQAQEAHDTARLALRRGGHALISFSRGGSGLLPPLDSHHRQHITLLFWYYWPDT